MKNCKLNLLDKTFALMAEKGLTYGEARAELGRRGAARRAENRRRLHLGKALMERMGLA